MIEVPDAFAGVTAHREGEAGRAWLKALPAIVDELLERADRTTLAEVADNEHAVATLGQLSRRLAVEAPAGLPRLRDMVAG